MMGRGLRLVDSDLFRGTILCTGLLMMTACSGNVAQAPSRSQPDPQQEISQLEERLLEAEKRAIVGEIESARLRRRVHELEEQLATTHRPRGQASTTAPPPRASNTLPTPFQDSGPQEATSPPEPVMQDAAGVEVEDLEDLQPSDPPSAPDLTQAPPEVSPTGSEASAATVVPPNDQTFAAYDSAYVLFHEKRYREAEEKFKQFVLRYPNTELTDNAQFWIGECRYARQDYGAALEAFSATVANHPGGNKVPDALLKAGKCLEALGRKDQARQTYLEIQRRFAGTAVAFAAEERLVGLD